MAGADDSGTTRRDLLISAAAATGGATLAVFAPSARAQLPPRIKPAAPGQMQAAIQRITGGKPVTRGKVKLTIPPLVENGNTVQYSVSVVSPMSATDHVKAIHIFNEKNPQPRIVSAFLGPRAGRAAISGRARLANSQDVVAMAEMSDGTFWSDTASVIVTIAACTEEGIP